jgi:small subunit ribosomal protein S21
MHVERREGETNDQLLSRFRQAVQRSGVLRELKQRRHFTSKSEMRRLAKAKAIRKSGRRARLSTQR